MKIKNLAFYGVMAAILGSVGTARADDSTIIASKGYVDAYAQKDADRVRTTWTATSSDDKASTAKYPSMATLQEALTTVEGNIQSVDTNALARPTADDPKLTKVSAIKGMVTTSGVTGNVRNNNLNAADNASDQKVPSEKAVAVELGLKEDYAATVPVLRSGQTAFSTVDANHSVGVNLGDLDALKEDKSNKQAAQTGTVTPWDAATADDTKYPTVKAVAQQISASNPESIASNALAATGDDVNKLTKASAIQAMADNTTTVYTTRNASNELTGSGSSTKVPTTAAVVTALKNLDGLGADGSNGLSAGDMTNNQSRLNRPVVKVTQTDGLVTAELGQIGANGIEPGAINPSHVTFMARQGNYTAGWGDASVSAANDQTNGSNLGAGKASKDQYVPTMLAVEKYVGENAIAPNANITASTDHSIVTYDAHGLVTGGISLPGLNDINDATTDAACTQGAPCVLSYYVNNGTKYYKWTNMDTEGLNAVNDSNS